MLAFVRTFDNIYRAKLLYVLFRPTVFTIKTTVGKEYKEPKGRNGGAMLKLEYDKKEIEGVIDKIVKRL